MIGAIIGDIAGSRFEWNNHRSKDFELLTPKCFCLLYTSNWVISPSAPASASSFRRMVAGKWRRLKATLVKTSAPRAASATRRASAPVTARGWSM